MLSIQSYVFHPSLFITWLCITLLCITTLCIPPLFIPPLCIPPLCISTKYPDYNKEIDNDVTETCYFTLEAEWESVVRLKSLKIILKNEHEKKIQHADIAPNQENEVASGGGESIDDGVARGGDKYHGKFSQ